MEKDLKSFTLEELGEMVKACQAKTFLAKYNFTFIHQNFLGTAEEKLCVFPRRQAVR